MSASPADSNASGTAVPGQVSLTEEEVRSLRDAGRRWATTPRARGTDGKAPEEIDPDLDLRPARGTLPGDRYVRGARSRRREFEKVSEGYLQTREEAAQPRTQLGRLRRTLLGRPIASRQAIHERLTKVKALAVLSSDALSSVAYATEQILLVLGAAGAAAYSYSVPIMGAILFLLIAVGLSYRQTIKAYPKGGGSYIVASDNLGPLAGVVAGSALMTDYVLTVAVSVASGVDSIVSAAQAMQAYRVELCVGFVVLLIVGNLRGIRESGSIFAAPTYLFIAGIFVMLTVIAIRWGTGHLAAATPTLEHATRQVSIFLLLKAFASGCTALTGVEAISDGVPAFQPPEWKNARTTLTVMVTLLALMFSGITLAARAVGARAYDSNDPHYQTVISQIAHAAFGTTLLYFYVIGATTAILVLAANTSFSDFPRLFFFMARDDYAPHLFKRLGDRLAYSNGILVLGSLAIVLLVVFRGRTDSLIPLYTIGVFLAFTMSQAGMVARWLRLREPGWQRGLAINAVGMTLTATVFLITAWEKFLTGAWVVLVIIPLLVLTFRAIHRHYADVTTELTTETPTSPSELKPVVIVPVSDLNGPALQSLALARTISDQVIAVHISDDPEEIARLKAKWEAWGNHVPLEIIESPYRSLVRPLLAYIDAIDRQQPDDTIVVVLPEMVATRWWQQILHNQTALRLKAALLFRPGTVVVNVPYHLRRYQHQRRRLRARHGGGDAL
ncbi:MAG TPA: APC family permease [Candidatus Dormibacteraeota bacterium]|nr:APC family permease [Candidatus Dormibacteraeota bacterium]